MPALAQQPASEVQRTGPALPRRSGDGDRHDSDRYQRPPRGRNQEGAQGEAVRPGGRHARVGEPNPYAPKAGAPNPYATQGRHAESVRHARRAIRIRTPRSGGRAAALSRLHSPGAMDLPAQLQPGLTGRAELVVGEEHTAPRVGSGLVHVLATPVMINLFEAAALDAVDQHLPAGYQSLGTVLNVRHIAATPVGMKVLRVCQRSSESKAGRCFSAVEARRRKGTDRRRPARARRRQRREVQPARAAQAGK